jgi:hypothetical protein
MVIGYALLELALVVLAVPILVAEALFLLSMLWSPNQATAAQHTVPKQPAFRRT